MLQGEKNIFYLFHKDIYLLWPNVTYIYIYIYKLSKIVYGLPAMHIGIEKACNN